MDQFIRQDIFQIILYPCFFVFILFLIVLSDKQITRVTVFFWGLTLIALAGYVAYSLMTWRITAEVLIQKQKISQEAFNEYDRLANYLLWFVPFLTGALGTNLISDALTKPLKYKKPFRILHLAITLIEGSKMLLQILFVIAISPLLFIAGGYAAIKNIKDCPRKWRIFGKLYNRSYIQKYRKSKQPYES